MSYEFNIKQCHHCKEHSQSKNGGCWGACPCRFDGKDIRWHARAGDCPLGKFLQVTVAGKPAEPPPTDWQIRGPALWAELHAWALSDVADPYPWLRAFSLRVLCGECRIHWSQWVRANPPPEEARDLFGWSVAAHNAVNVRLGKPQMTVEAALAVWQRITP